MTQPVSKFIPGITVPPDRCMGYAGRFYGRQKLGPRKKAALEVAGVRVVRNPAEIGENVKTALDGLFYPS